MAAGSWWRRNQASVASTASFWYVKELVAQNHSKYCALGLEADIFAAGLQRKESQGPEMRIHLPQVADDLLILTVVIVADTVALIDDQ
jgi:hypothetical protein